MKYAHYTNFGATAAPPCADADGYLAYREDFQDLPPGEWTEAEDWIHEAEQRVERFRKT